MTAALGQLRFTIATLIKGLAPGTALQMLHDAAADACLEHEKYPDDLSAAQREVVDRDLERTLGEIEAAAIEPAAKWSAAHPNEPQVWPTMIAGRGPRGAPCGFYSTGLMEFPEERTAWFDQADLDYLSAVDPETLAHAHKIVERGERHIEVLEYFTTPLDALTAAATAPLEWLSEPGTEQCGFWDLWCRMPKVAGLVGGVLALAVLGMFPGPVWTRVVGAGGTGVAVWFMGTQRQGGA